MLCFLSACKSGSLSDSILECSVCAVASEKNVADERVSRGHLPGPCREEAERNVATTTQSFIFFETEKPGIMADNGDLLRVVFVSQFEDLKAFDGIVGRTRERAITPLAKKLHQSFTMHLERRLLT